ncbi:MAG: hypothetical protein KBT88_09685 [Gammaproteobacteria bacterium]|nr:hypothetical protein [Gammaproteobacteria bacterium]MBQ0840045.1 hypothetical protein [Gammaproteobacteria bacterium]
MLKTLLYISLIACLLISLLFFYTLQPQGIDSRSAANTPTAIERGKSPLEKISPPDNSEKSTVRSREELSQAPTVIAAIAAEDKMRNERLRKDIIRNYKKTRNLYYADTSLNTADKQQLITQLDTAVFGDQQPDYAQTSEDLDDQALYREIMLNFQYDTQNIKADSSLSRQQKEDSIRQLLSQFITDIDG